MALPCGRDRLGVLDAPVRLPCAAARDWRGRAAAGCRAPFYNRLLTNYSAIIRVVVPLLMGVLYDGSVILDKDAAIGTALKQAR